MKRQLHRLYHSGLSLLWRYMPALNIENENREIFHCPLIKSLEPVRNQSWYALLSKLHACVYGTSKIICEHKQFHHLYSNYIDQGGASTK